VNFSAMSSQVAIRVQRYYNGSYIISTRSQLLSNEAVKYLLDGSWKGRYSCDIGYLIYKILILLKY
jgi:hypothetical protein